MRRWCIVALAVIAACGRFGFGHHDADSDAPGTGDGLRDGDLPLRFSYLKASNTSTFDRFGFAIAFSADGKTLAVGAPAEDCSIPGINASDGSTNNLSMTGAIYIYVRVGDAWVQQAYMKPAVIDLDDQFGVAFALSANGDTLAVGMPSEDSASTSISTTQQADNAAPDSGAVLVFTRSAGVWSQDSYIKCSNCEGGDQFGWSVALSADGNTLAAGAYGEDSADTGINAPGASNAAAEAGATYVFVRSGNVWAQQAYIKPWNTTGGDGFGYSVALSDDGNTLAVGSPGEDGSVPGIQQGSLSSDDNVVQAGAAYVFTRAGTTWSQQAYVKSDPVGFGGDFFGHPCALSGDGNVLACGAPGEDSIPINGPANSGAAWVFRRTGTVWATDGYIKASNAGDNDQFGSSVAIAGNGGVLMVGSPMEDSNATGLGGDQMNEASADSGAVYVYARNAGGWEQTAYAKGSTSDSGDQFGFAVSLSADGLTYAATANFEDSAATGVDGDATNNGATDSGCATVAFY